MKNILCCVVLLLVGLSCDKDDNLPPNNNGVSIKTLSHTINNDGGVTLVGQINNVEVPIDYGFIIKTEKNQTTGNIQFSYDNIKMNTGIHNGEFSIDFKSDLRQGVTYYYNSVALKNGDYIFGKEKAFLSKGSASPQINSIVPNKAHLGDTIVINGRNFSKSPEVYFNTRQSKLLVKNDTLIKCIVVNNENYNADKLPQLELEIKSWTQDETVTNEFALHTPKVDSIRPFEAFPGDTITIYGDHFSKDPYGSNRLIIPSNIGAHTYPKVVKATQKELQFIIGGISVYKPSIVIESQHQTIEVKNKFKLALPTITGFSKNKVKYGDQLVVYGTNFPSRYTNRDSTEYKFGNKNLNFFETYRDSLVIDISDQTDYSDFVIKGLSINLFGFETQYNEAIILDENYVRVSFQSENIFYMGTLNDDIYALTHSGSILEKHYMKLDMDTYRFEPLFPNRPVTNAPTSLKFEYYKSKFYSIEGYSAEPTFYSYDIVTNQKTKLANPPGMRSSAFTAVSGDYFYYGLGNEIPSDDNSNDIWRYSFSQNTWEFVADLPDIHDYKTFKKRPLSFVIGDKIYIGGGQSNVDNSQAVDFWELDTNTNTVTRKSDLPIPISESIKGTAINGYGVFDYNGETHTYNPDTNQWAVKQMGLNFPSINTFLYQTEDFVLSQGNNYLIKIKKSHFTE